MQQLTLDLAPAINRIHEELAGLVQTSLVKAIEIGELLTRQKAELKHGQWLPWCQENLEFGQASVTKYLKLYGERDKLLSDSNLGVNEAYRLLSTVDSGTEAEDRDRNAVHFSSQTGEWPTPLEFFDDLNAEFNFTVDVCATPENAKCDQYFTKDDDGLAQSWTGSCWMNPPYGSVIGDWMAKAHAAAMAGATVVCLVPSRTDTGWWHDYAMRHEIRFIRGRLKFGEASTSAPFPSALVIMREDADPSMSAIDSLPTARRKSEETDA